MLSLGLAHHSSGRPDLAADYSFTTVPAAASLPVQDAHRAVAVQVHDVAVRRAHAAAEARQRARDRARAARRAAAQEAAQAPAPVAAAAAPPPAAPGGGVLSAAQIGALWLAEGGSPAAENTAICIAEAESGGNINAVSQTSDDGLYQEHLRPDVLGNAALSTQVAIQMSGNGQDWSAWTTSGRC